MNFFGGSWSTFPRTGGFEWRWVLCEEETLESKGNQKFKVQSKVALESRSHVSGRKQEE